MSYLALALVTTALVTYLLRVIPLVAFRRRLESTWVRSFLFYVPWAVLTAMTIPAIFFATTSPLSGAVGLIAALGLALARRSLLTVALGAGLAVWLAELALLA
ncbi:MAG: AzlD domain-containing protein [Bowdeniella nasicola]|nr:AzlD domain-containing protein [Bowdeniella nasicola]